MARMRRIQVVIDPELDDRLGREAATLGMSKSSLIRQYVRHHLDQGFDNRLWSLPTFDDVEPVENIDEFLYGTLQTDA
jgi:Ribbon-helix-helix protein, copG family